MITWFSPSALSFLPILCQHPFHFLFASVFVFIQLSAYWRITRLIEMSLSRVFRLLSPVLPPPLCPSPLPLSLSPRPIPRLSPPPVPVLRPRPLSSAGHPCRCSCSAPSASVDHCQRQIGHVRTTLYAAPPVPARTECGAPTQDSARGQWAQDRETRDVRSVSGGVWNAGASSGRSQGLLIGLITK